MRTEILYWNGFSVTLNIIQLKFRIVPDTLTINR